MQTWEMNFNGNEVVCYLMIHYVDLFDGKFGISRYQRVS